MFPKTNCLAEYKYSRYFTQIRNARKEHWAEVQRKRRPMDKAIEHFDDFYKSVFGDKLWRSLRLGLHCPNKYAAVINNFCDPDSAKTELENRGAINLKSFIELQKTRLLEIDEERKQKHTFNIDEKMDDVMEKSSKKDENPEENVDPKLQIFQKMYLEEKLETYVGKLSLEEGLKDAQFDESRIIHPDNEMSYASLHEFTPATKLKGLDEYVPESQHYSYYSTTIDFPITIKDDETSLNVPPHLDIYLYEKSNVTQFPQPKRRLHSNTLDYFLLDGASVLPVLALDLQPGDRLLDMCSAPGGKAYTAFQSLYLDSLVCNDIIESRVSRIKRVIEEYFTDDEWRKKIQITKQNAMYFNDEGVYNKILVDVPCTNDRSSLKEKENNMFSPHRIQERLKIPELQADLLMTALRAVAVGGTVVYSTCSLSPIQNDGVVQMALRKLWADTNYQFSIM